MSLLAIILFILLLTVAALLLGEPKSQTVRIFIAVVLVVLAVLLLLAGLQVVPIALGEGLAGIRPMLA